MVTLFSEETAELQISRLVTGQRLHESLEEAENRGFLQGVAFCNIVGRFGLSVAFGAVTGGHIYMKLLVAVTGALNIGADVNAQVGGLLAADAAIGGGTETIGFGNPPAATPEPGTLSLMGTGLRGVAGVLRRKFRV